MTVGKLKELLKDIPDEMQVLVPMNPMERFNGAFFSPCEEMTGVGDLGIEEETDEMRLLNQESASEKSFVIVPCGFFEDHEDERQMVEMN